MRAAVYHGPFQQMLGMANDNAKWREIFGPKHKRAKDQELILRFLALKYNSVNYMRPMKGFLNSFMAENRNSSAHKISEYQACFEKTIERSYEALGRQAFRISRTMNVAFFDALMVAVADVPGANAAAIKSASEKLSQDREFIQLTSEATSNESSVLGRLSQAKEVLNAFTANTK